MPRCEPIEYGRDVLVACRRCGLPYERHQTPLCSVAMTVEEARDEIVACWGQRDQEFVCSDAEQAESDRQLAEVLRTIGEMDG